MMMKRIYESIRGKFPVISVIDFICDLVRQEDQTGEIGK